MVHNDSKDNAERATLDTPALSREHSLHCPGIQASNPRDFLAALGFLRLLNAFFDQEEFALKWHDDFSPIYRTNAELPTDWPDIMISKLKKWTAIEPHPFAYDKIIAIPPDEFRGILKNAAVTEGSSYRQLRTELFASYASQVHLQKTKGVIEVSGLSFSNGQSGKNLLHDIRELISESAITGQQLVADLQGIGDYRADLKSFRWNPSENRASAYRGPDPGASIKGDSQLDYPCLNILAFFGLSFFPVVDTQESSHTCGLVKRSRAANTKKYDTFFTWPSWGEPLTRDEVFSLINHPALQAPQPDFHTLDVIGCFQIWQSQRYSMDKSLYFAPAEPVIVRQTKRLDSQART